MPVDAYRGAGRPEAAYVLERLVDACARKLGIAPEEMRARNFVKPDADALPHADRPRLRRRRFRGRDARLPREGRSCRLRGARGRRAKRGAVRGFGFASYIECTAWGEGEEGSVELERNGDFTVLIGTQSNGQGHETAYAQVVSQYLDVPLERIKVVQGDTDRDSDRQRHRRIALDPDRRGDGDPRLEKLAASLKELAADKLEAAVADLEIADGSVRIAGTDRAISYAEIAALPARPPRN